MRGREKFKDTNPMPVQLERIGRLKQFQRGEMLFGAQDEAKGMYYVKHGEIRVYKMDEQGKEVEVVRLESGDFFGEAIAFVAPVFPVFAQAVKDSQVLFFDKKEIFYELEREPDIAKFFINLLAKKCVTLSNKIESLGLQTVRQRLIQYLISNCSGDQKCVVELKIKKGELAKALGTINETLSRNLKQMQEQGLIEVKGSKILVKNCQNLRAELTRA